VREATAAYFEEQDSFSAWIEQECEIVRNCRAFPAELLASWKAYAEAAGEHPGTMKNFVSKLEGRGVWRTKSGGNRFIIGIKLREGMGKRGRIGTGSIL
jgi:putative DNA primase/helicase